MRDQRESRRDVTLTTLIDLLVQVVFVLTMLLLASDAIQGTAEERGYATPEAWKTLVSIFDVDIKRSFLEQARSAVRQFRALRDERDRAMAEAKKVETLQDNLAKADRKIAELEAKARGGAPGLPPCRYSDGKEMTILRVNVDAAGKIANVFLPDANAVRQIADQTSSFSGKVMSPEEFERAFNPWLRYGSSLQPKCKYTALVEYNPQGTRRDLQRALAYIGSVFRRKGIQAAGNQ